MNKDKKLDKYFMKIAMLTAENSHAQRQKVGAVLVREGRIISIGWNGQPSGWNNCCEETVVNSDGHKELKTLPTVIHAEANALYWCARTEIISKGGTMYLTLSPCAHCALAMIQSGVSRVVYLNKYRDLAGIKILKKAKIKVEQIQL